MKKLRPEIIPEIRYAVKCNGCFHPDVIMGQFVELLYPDEVSPIRDFLSWVVSENRTFGWNLPDVYDEYISLAERELSGT